MYVGFERTVYMKLSKVLFLLSAFALVACGTTNSSSSVSESNKVESTSEISAPTSEGSTSVSTSESVVSTTSSTSISSSESSTSISSSTTTTSSEPVTTDKTVTVNLYNPSCGTMSTEVLNTRLATYINGLADTPFVTEITNTKSQIGANFPEQGQSILIMGSASSAGNINFIFNVTIKKVTITAGTYYKSYTNYSTGQLTTNVDANSQMQIAGRGIDPIVLVDLKPENNQPVEKTFDLDINSTTLGLNSVNAENGRVFIKSMTFVY